MHNEVVRIVGDSRMNATLGDVLHVVKNVKYIQKQDLKFKILIYQNMVL